MLPRCVRLLVKGDMGIRERQSRERDTVRRKILNAARTLFLNESYGQRVDAQDRRTDCI